LKAIDCNVSGVISLFCVLRKATKAKIPKAYFSGFFYVSNFVEFV